MFTVMVWGSASVEWCSVMVLLVMWMGDWGGIWG